MPIFSHAFILIRLFVELKYKKKQSQPPTTTKLISRFYIYFIHIYSIQYIHYTIYIKHIIFCTDYIDNQFRFHNLYIVGFLAYDLFFIFINLAQGIQLVCVQCTVRKRIELSYLILFSKISNV